MPELRRSAIATIALSVVSVPVTLTHSFEDFEHGIPARFGLDPLLAAFLLSLAYAIQVLSTAGLARGYALAFAANAGIAAVWLFGALLDHLPEVLFDGRYRAGLISKALEVGIMLVAAAWLVCAVVGWRDARRSATR